MNVCCTYNLHKSIKITVDNEFDEPTSVDTTSAEPEEEISMEFPDLEQQTLPSDSTMALRESNIKEDSCLEEEINSKEDENPNPKEDQPNHMNRWSLQEHPNKGTPVRNSPSLGSIPKHKRASKCSKDELSDLPETWDEECQKHLVDFAER